MFNHGEMYDLLEKRAANLVCLMKRCTNPIKFLLFSQWLCHILFPGLTPQLLTHANKLFSVTSFLFFSFSWDESSFLVIQFYCLSTQSMCINTQPILSLMSNNFFIILGKCMFWVFITSSGFILCLSFIGRE